MNSKKKLMKTDKMLTMKKIFDLMKNLVEILSTSQLIQLMRTIETHLVGNENTNQANSETFAESIDIDTTRSSNGEMSTNNEIYFNSFDDEISCNINDFSHEDYLVNQPNRAMITAKEIIGRQCGHLNFPMEKDLRYISYLTNHPVKSNMVLDNYRSSTKSPPLVCINSSISRNFNNTISENFMFYPSCQKRSNNSEMSYPSEIKINDEFHGEVTEFCDNDSHAQSSSEYDINESDEIRIEDNFISTHYLFLLDIIPISCIPFRPVTPYLTSVSGLHRSLKSAVIIKKVKRLHRKSRSCSKKKSIRERSKIETKSIDDIAIMPKLTEDNNPEFTKHDNVRRKKRTVTFSEISPKNLNKLVQEHIMRSWACTYIACKHSNSTKTQTCALCFNPRWNYYSRSVRDSLCAKCGYVNYKTRASCKKCRLPFSPKFGCLNRRLS